MNIDTLTDWTGKLMNEIFNISSEETLVLFWIFSIASYFLVVSIRYGRIFLKSGQFLEETLINNGTITIKELQDSSWSIQAQKTLTFASFGLATFILFVMFIAEGEYLQRVNNRLVHLSLIVYGLVVMFYFLSMQWWFLALDRKNSKSTYALKYRRKATTYQTVGWILIMFSLIITIMIVNKWVGACFVLVSIMLMIWLFQEKFQLNYLELRLAAITNDFQDKLVLDEIYLKNEDCLTSLDTNIVSPKIVSWNIERGYDISSLSAYLLKENPDIICLQEVDWNNKRTGSSDVLLEISQKLNMLGYYGIEFYELDFPLRDASLAGGGVHGNAILTKIKPLSVYRVDLPVFFDWENPPSDTPNRVLNEVRKGGRFVLCAEFMINGQITTVCSAHFEDKSGGVLARKKSLEVLLNGLRNNERVIIGGDLNTFDNRLSRLLGFSKEHDRDKACGDFSECECWSRVYLEAHSLKSPFSCEVWTFKYLFFKEKLDWLIVKNVEVESSGAGDFNSSDHKPLWIKLK